MMVTQKLCYCTRAYIHAHIHTHTPTYAHALSSDTTQHIAIADEDKTECVYAYRHKLRIGDRSQLQRFALQMFGLEKDLTADILDNLPWTNYDYKRHNPVRFLHPPSPPWVCCSRTTSQPAV